ncbi:uncharacterized protein RCH25_025632 [Pelodytes ibericus]
MNEIMHQYQNITPITLQISAEITTSQFHNSSAKGFDGQIANVVEVFLVEIYRCKLCQFTSSLKNKMCLHVSDVHQLDNVHFIQREIGTDQEENDSYGIGEESAQGNNENEENLEKMPFLLPMYRILNTMSSGSSDVSLGHQSSNANCANASEMNSLFEEEDTSQFQLDKTGPSDSIPPSSTANSPTYRKSKDEEDAQCEHLLSLGLCHVSSIRSHGSLSKPKTLKCEAKEPFEMQFNDEKDRTVDGLLLDQCQEAGDLCKEKYICPTCQLEMKTKETYKIHMQCHNVDGDFKCFYCGCCISEWNQMKQHIQDHKQKRESYQCQVCQKRFMTQRAWKVHMRTHRGKSDVFFCTKCPLSFETERVRNLHLTCHHEDIFRCFHCGLIYQEWSKLYEHLGNHDSRLKPYICSTCNKKFFRAAQLKAHSSRHKSVACSLCDQTFKTNRQLYQHQKHFHKKQIKEKSKPRDKTENDICVPESEVGTSLPTTNSETGFKCELCNRKCSCKMALQRHMGVHAGEKPFQCQHCEYKTRLKASLIQHMRIHTGEKPFKCKLCSYASIDSSSLRRHTRTHTCEKPYMCRHCNYSSIQKKSLDLHIRRHHTGEMFKCSFCKYSTPDKQLLQKHAKKYHATAETATKDS